MHFQAYMLEGIVSWKEDREEAVGYTCYDLQLRSTYRAFGLRVFNTDLDPQLQAPREFTGEKMGIEYLFDQTGKSFEEVITDVDVEDEGEKLLETLSPTEEEEYPAEMEAVDPTISIAEPPVISSDIAAEVLAVEQPEDKKEIPLDVLAVVQDGQEGFHLVKELSSYLVVLRQARCLTEAQVNILIPMFKALSDADQRRLKYAPRYEAKTKGGRFSTGRSGVVPGLTSVKRSFEGGDSTAVQWLDNSRIVEAICDELVLLHPYGKRSQKRVVPMWSRVLSDYSRIRQMVYGSA